MTTHLRLDRRLAILALLLAGLIGTGLVSWATVSDNLIVTNNISVLTVDLVVSKNGTTYTQSLSQSVLMESGGNSAAVIAVKNSGNGAANVSFAGTGSGAAGLLATEFRVYSVANAAACSAAVTGTNLASGGSTVGSAVSSPTITFALAAGATQWLCEVFAPNGAFTGTDTAIQTLTLIGSATLGTQ